jgi:hypothetical protein
MAPKIIDTLMDTTGKYSQALRESGGDLTRYAQTLGRMGVGGAEMERLARTSEFLSDPMKTLVRIATKMLRYLEFMVPPIVQAGKGLTDLEYLAQTLSAPGGGRSELKRYGGG